MAHSQETRDKVRQLFIEGMPLKGAAVANGVSYDSAQEWKAKAYAAGDNWESAKAAYQISGKGIDDLNQQMVESMVRQMLTVQREIEASPDLSAAVKVELLAQTSDSYSKFSKAFAKVNPKYHGLSVSLDTFKTIVDYLRVKDPKALAALQPHIEPIGAVLGKRYGD